MKIKGRAVTVTQMMRPYCVEIVSIFRVCLFYIYKEIYNHTASTSSLTAF